MGAFRPLFRARRDGRRKLHAGLCGARRLHLPALAQTPLVGSGHGGHLTAVAGTLPASHRASLQSRRRFALVRQRYAGRAGDYRQPQSRAQRSHSSLFGVHGPRARTIPLFAGAGRSRLGTRYTDTSGKFLRSADWLRCAGFLHRLAVQPGRASDGDRRRLRAGLAATSPPPRPPHADATSPRRRRAGLRPVVWPVALLAQHPTRPILGRPASGAGHRPAA